MDTTPYQHLARRLDQLPQGYPPSANGTELKILAKLFSPEEAELAAHLRITAETAEPIALRAGAEPAAVRKLLKGLVRRGLIGAAKTEGGLGFYLLPFVVGFYENQAGSMDREFAELYDQYYREVLGKSQAAVPAIHRVIPVYESVPKAGDIRPFENVVEIINRGQSWGVVDCVCRKQKALIGDPCPHPLDVCLQISPIAGAFEGASWVRSLTHDEAMLTLKKAADAGLVHTVNNTRADVWYICNCCTCSCGILRGILDLGLASVAAHSGFINRVDEDLCILCGECVDHCPFLALSLEDRLVIDELRCAGCGVCNSACPQSALHLDVRPAEELINTPEDNSAWRRERAQARKLSLEDVL